jgi:carbonic anhydrase
MAGVFDDVLRANDAYARDFRLAGLEPSAARGLAVLTCFDSRIEPLAMLGIGPGDAKIMRNAGGRLTDDVLRGLVLSRYLLGVDRLMIVAHTECRVTAESDDWLRELIREAGGPGTDELELLAAPDPRAVVAADVQRVRSSHYLEGLDVGGFVYDVDTGRLEQIV